MDKIVHFEIPVKNADKASKFYNKTFGWQINKVGDVSGNSYFLSKTVKTDDKGMPLEPGAINGALMVDKNINSTILVIKVSSIEDYLKKIKNAGGKIVMDKVNVGNMGLYARFTDTEGNLLALWQDIIS